MALWSPDGRTQISGFPGGAPKRNSYGQAQPIQPQPQGTPYGSPAARPSDPRTGDPSLPPPTTGGPLPPARQSQDFSVYRPQQAPAAQPAYGNPFAQYNPQQMGNFVQQQMGLPSFQFTATDAFGRTFDNPAALTAQQGAMAQALNAQRAQQIQSGQRAPLNPQAAYQQAQQMIEGGWTNPFAMPDSQQMGTMGGPATDPRWSHNGGQWQSGQAQPIQPPSQGTPWGGMPEYGLPQPAQSPPRQPATSAQPQADEPRARDQAKYDELMQQIRLAGGGSTRLQDIRKADLERRLGIGQPASGAGAAQPVQPPSRGTPSGQADPLPSEEEWRRWLGGSWVSKESQDDFRRRGEAAGYVYDPLRTSPRPSQAQPVPPPSQGNPYGQPAGGAPPFDPDYARWRGQQVQTMEYRGPEGEAARERAMRQRYERERGGDRPPSQYPVAWVPRRDGLGRDPVGMPVLKAPEVWTNPSDPDWLKNELRSKPDTRPVVWDERNNRYIKNPTFVGAPGYEAFLPQRPAPPQRYEPGFAYTRR